MSDRKWNSWPWLTKCTSNGDSIILTARMLVTWKWINSLVLQNYRIKWNTFTVKNFCEQKENIISHKAWCVIKIWHKLVMMTHTSGLQCSKGIHSLK